MKVLVLGGSGMLGHTAFRVFSETAGLDTFATLRTNSVARTFPEALRERLLVGVDVLDQDALAWTLAAVRPHVVVNCVGLVKQLGNAADPLAALPLNALFPHRLARLCDLSGARVVHVSTDCVFRGDRGGYRESDDADATDLYGRSKLLGELDVHNAVTLRTSIIGRELGSSHGLVDWFLSQTGSVRGFSRAVFSGVTTDELARIIVSRVLDNSALHGVWHVSSSPITKLNLLKIVRDVYEKDIEIVEDDALVIDRSLDSSRFREATGYEPPPWDDMIKTMRKQEFLA
jgi:dTDP-4-dehydrorhamnose reductase